MYTILYIQTNEQIAKSVKEHFPAGECEFLIADSGDKALTICSQRDIFLIIVDANIPDMKQSDFLKKLKESYPKIYLAVCVNRTDVSRISEIATDPNVKKIFMEPLDIDEMADEIMDTYDAYKIKMDFKEKEAQLQADEDNFEQTLRHLKASLIRQKYSYNKLNPLFEGTLTAFTDRNTMSAQTSDFIKSCCQKVLLLETTSTVNMDNFTDMIRTAVDEISDKYKIQISIGDINNSFTGDVSRNNLINIVYAVYLISGYEALKGSNAVLGIKCSHMSSSSIVLDITCNISGEETKGHMIEDTQSYQELKEYMSRMLILIGEGSGFAEREGSDRFNIIIRV